MLFLQVCRYCLIGTKQYVWMSNLWLFTLHPVARRSKSISDYQQRPLVENLLLQWDLVASIQNHQGLVPLLDPAAPQVKPPRPSCCMWLSFDEHGGRGGAQG